MAGPNLNVSTTNSNDRFPVDSYAASAPSIATTEDKKSVRVITRRQFAFQFLVGPLAFTVMGIINIVTGIFKLLAACCCSLKERKYSCRDAGKDFLKILFTPLAVVGLEIGAFCGMCYPKAGMSLNQKILKNIHIESFNRRQIESQHPASNPSQTESLSRLQLDKPD